MMNDLPISPKKKFKYSITFQSFNEESLEAGDSLDNGYEIEHTVDLIGDILYEANTTYGIYMPVSFGTWESTEPEQDRDFFEKGISKYYALHLTNEDGTEISQEESDFISFLLSDGRYEIDKFRDYAVGGIVLGSIVLGIGALITYFYFKGKKPSVNKVQKPSANKVVKTSANKFIKPSLKGRSKSVIHNINGKKRKFPIKDAWRKEHSTENKSENYEVPQEDRFEMGGDASEHYHEVEYGEGGVARAKDVIINKIGFNEYVADYLVGTSEKFAIWLADTILKDGIKETNSSKKDVLKVFNERSKSVNNNFITSVYSSNIREILDWLQHPLTPKQNLKELSFDQALEKARDWHQELQVLGGDIDFTEPETNQILKKYPVNSDDIEYYWAFIPSNYCDLESSRMGHCGRTGYGNNLISLRSVKPYGKGHTISDSHVTIAYGVNDGMFYQVKGKKNNKPAEKYFPYIFDLIKTMLTDEEIKHKFNEDDSFTGFGNEYQSSEDYGFEDMSKEQIREVYDLKPTLFESAEDNYMLLDAGVITLDEFKEIVEREPDTFSSFGNQMKLYERGIITEQPSTSFELNYDCDDVYRLLEIDRDFSDDLVAQVLCGDVGELYDGWGHYYDNPSDLVSNLNKENEQRVIDEIVRITKLDESVVKENGIEYYLNGNDENFNPNDDFDNIIRTLASAQNQADNNDYYKYLYGAIESALNELGTVHSLNDEGVKMTIELSNNMSFDEIAEGMDYYEFSDVEDLFNEKIGEDFDKPRLSIDDRYSPYGSSEDFNDYVSEDLERGYKKGGYLGEKNINKNMKTIQTKLKEGGNVGYSKEDYFLVVKNWVYFTFNYPMGFVKDAFGSSSISTHLQEKFSSSYERFGSYGVLISFWGNLDANNREILSLWIKNNYLSFNEGKTELQSISDDNYAKIITHWNMFCYNFDNNFVEKVFEDNSEHFENKWVRSYERAGSTGAVNKFFTELSGNNQKLLTDWVYDNHKHIRFADGGEADKNAHLTNGQKNKMYLDDLSTRNAIFLSNKLILENISKNYGGIGIKRVENEIYDNDAEMLYEYIANDDDLRIRVYGEMEFMFRKDKKFADGGRVTTNDGIIEAFLTSNKQLKVGNLSTHFNEYDNEMLLRNYGTLIATRKGNDVSITNTKYSKTTTIITNKVNSMALNKGMNVNNTDKFADGGEAGKYVLENQGRLGYAVLNTETNMYVDIDFQSKEDAENFIIEKNREIRLFGFEPRLNVGSEGYADGGEAGLKEGVYNVNRYTLTLAKESGDNWKVTIYDNIKKSTKIDKVLPQHLAFLESLKIGKVFADGGGVKNEMYKKFGDENYKLVNFDLSELDNFEEMQYNHLSKNSSKAEVLQVFINNVEGDYSQLSDNLSEIAEEQYPSDEFFEDNRQYADGGKAGDKSVKRPIRKKRQPKVARTQFEEETYEYKKGGGIGIGRYSILAELSDSEEPRVYKRVNNRNEIAGMVDKVEVAMKQLGYNDVRIFVTDEKTDDEVYNYAEGGSLNDYIDEQVDEFDDDENKMREQYRGDVRDIEYQGFLAIDTSLTPNERLSDYEFDGEEFDRDNLLEVAKKYPQAEYITFHARLMGDSDFGIEDELSPIDDLAMEFDMAKLNQYAEDEYAEGGETYSISEFSIYAELDGEVRFFRNPKEDTGKGNKKEYAISVMIDGKKQKYSDDYYFDTEKKANLWIDKLNKLQEQTMTKENKQLVKDWFVENDDRISELITDALSDVELIDFRGYVKSQKKKKYAKGGMIKHGLRIGDEITFERTHTNKIGIIDHLGEKHTVDLDKGKRYAEGGEAGEIKLLSNEFEEVGYNSYARNFGVVQVDGKDINILVSAVLYESDNEEFEEKPYEWYIELFAYPEFWSDEYANNIKHYKGDDINPRSLDYLSDLQSYGYGVPLSTYADDVRFSTYQDAIEFLNDNDKGVNDQISDLGGLGGFYFDKPNRISKTGWSLLYKQIGVKEDGGKAYAEGGETYSISEFSIYAELDGEVRFFRNPKEDTGKGNKKEYAISVMIDGKEQKGYEDYYFDTEKKANLWIDKLNKLQEQTMTKENKQLVKDWFVENDDRISELITDALSDVELIDFRGYVKSQKKKKYAKGGEAGEEDEDEYADNKFEYVYWDDIRSDKSDDNDGYIYGINFLDENNEVLDVQWFKTEEERDSFISEEGLVEVDYESDDEYAGGGRVKVGIFDENQLRNKEDKKAVEKAQKETGLNYVDTKIKKKGGKMFLEVYLISNEEYYNSSKFANGGGVEYAGGGRIDKMDKFISELAKKNTKEFSVNEYHDFRNKKYAIGVARHYFTDNDGSFSKFDTKLGDALNIDFETQGDSNKFAEGGKAGVKSVKKPIRKKPKMKVARTQFEEETYEYKKGGEAGDVEQNFEVGDIVELSESGWDNESYHDFFKGVDNIKLVITDVYTNESEHQGFDTGVGMALYSTKTLENDEEVPFDLYDYELEYGGLDLDGAKIIVKEIDVDGNFSVEYDEENDEWYWEENYSNGYNNYRGGFSSELKAYNNLIDYLEENNYAEGGRLQTSKLVVEETGEEVELPYKTKDFRGDDMVVIGFTEPRSSASEGRIEVEGRLAEYYPSVAGLKIISILPTFSVQNPNNFAEGGEVSEWMEEALASLIEETGNDDLEITIVSDNGNEFYATDDNVEYRVFKTEDDAEEKAIEGIREDMEESPENFNQDFLVPYIDGGDFFKEALDEMNYSYAEDIASESDSKYANRLIAELVENGLMDEDDAESDNAEELADNYKDDYVALLTEQQLDEGNNGLNYFISNFGEEETYQMVRDNNLIDIDSASRDAVNSDGIAHFLSSYDGETLYLSDDYVAYRVN